MLPCDSCAYKQEVPGDAHIQCVYRWAEGDAIPTGHPHGVKMGWFYFPVLFDPTWGPDTCVGFSTVRRDDQVDKLGGAHIMGLLLRNRI